MPPRKSNISQITADDGGTPTKERDGINVEDLSLPRTMVQRLAKGVLPPNTQIHKDAILAMQKGATVFINYLAQAANTTTQTNNRRTIPPGAIFDALQELEFEAFVPRVEAELRRFNEVQTGKRNEYRRKIKEGKGGGGGEGEGLVPVEGEEEGEGDAGRAAKRVRREEGEGAGEGVGGDGDGNAVDGGGRDEGDEDETLEMGEDAEAEADADAEAEAKAQEEDEEEGEEDDDDDDDEDEYPDEGRRLSSLDPETDAVHTQGLGGSSGDDSMSDGGSE